MERSEATFQAFDGVRLTLADGRTVAVPAFNTREAVHYLRLLARAKQGDAEAHYAFVSEFLARVALSGVPLSAFGFTFEVEGRGEVNGGGMTVARAVAFLGVLAGAQSMDGHGDQIEFLDTFAPAFGLDDLSPPEVFRAGIAFGEEVYRLLYGLAEDFLSHLASPPRAQVERATGTASESTPASMT